jgi:hypothetical protein
VLAGAGLGDDARLAEPPREQHLADAVVDLVRAGVVEVLALEEDPPATDRRQAAARRSAASGGRRSRGGSARYSAWYAGSAHAIGQARASSSTAGISVSAT